MKNLIISILLIFIISCTTEEVYVEENILGFNTYDIKPIDSRSVSDVSVESTGIIYKIA